MAIQFIKDVNVNGDLTATRLIKLGGTSSQFLKADGSVDSTGYLSSVGLTMPVAFSVANSPLTANGTLEVTAIGTASQYIRGDGQLATLPAGGGGGGSSVFYYLNGSVDASVATYKQMDNTPVIGGGTDFNLVGNGLIAQFLTDIGNPNRIQIPGGAWNFEMFFNMSSVGGNTKFYVELLKYNGATFTSIASNITVPEEITGGTSIDLYLTSIAVPETVLLTTDRLAIRVYIVDNSGGRTATLHTEDNTLCQVTTTFSAGVTSINGISENTQYLAVGTSGTDFNISSLLNTHTFNLPTASFINRGVLSSADWSTFNSKVGGSGTANYIPKFTNFGLTIGNSIISDNGTNVGIGTSSAFSKLEIVGGVPIGLTGNVTLRAIQNQTNYKGVGLGFDTSSHTGIVFAETTDTASNLAFWTYSGLSWAERMRITSGGAINIKDGNLTGGGGFEFTNEAGFGARFQSNAYKFMNSSNSSEFMRITSSGNVGIGTTSPGAKLDVISTVRTTNNDTDSFKASSFQMHVYDGTSVSYGGGMFQTNSASSYQQISANQTNIYAFRSGGMRLATGNAPIIFGTGNSDLDFSTERMRIASSGNVGIGTTSPGTKLQINVAPTGTQDDGMRVSDGTRIIQTNIVGNTYSYRGVGPNETMLYSTGNPLNIVSDSQIIKFTAGTSESMRITTAGNVGIGTTSPSQKLTIGDGTGTGNQYLRLYSSATDMYIGQTGSNLFGAGNGQVIVTDVTYSSNLAIGTLNSSANLIFGTASERMRITSAGNVGIGTTSPLSLLNVQGSGYFPSKLITLSGAEPFRYNANIGTNIINGNSIGLSFGTRSNNVDYDNTLNLHNGNVGIGTTSPAYKLQVVNSGNTLLQLNGNNTAGTIDTGFTISADDFKNIYLFQRENASTIFGTNNNERMRITSGGNVFIATLGTGLVYSNAGTLTSTNPSDERLKNNIADLNYGLNEILKLRPVTYNWKNDTINQGKQFGFIAQEVQEVMPELVKEFETEEGERLGLDKEGIYATLVKAIQEQQKQIEELKTLINK